jgi:hypothetical protein
MKSFSSAFIFVTEISLFSFLFPVFLYILLIPLALWAHGLFIHQLSIILDSLLKVHEGLSSNHFGFHIAFPLLDLRRYTSGLCGIYGSYAIEVCATDVRVYVAVMS